MVLAGTIHPAFTTTRETIRPIGIMAAHTDTTPDITLSVPTMAIAVDFTATGVVIMVDGVVMAMVAGVAITPNEQP